MSLFGSGSAVGRSFVFVIDRSQSMGGEGLGAIGAAAKELAVQLEQLTAQQRFQVVAYNQSVAMISERELLPADDQNKDKLIRFVADTAAYGQTEHMRGLLVALKLKPEVIFLLTDGGDPVLDNSQLRAIREQSRPGGSRSWSRLHAASRRGRRVRRLVAEVRVVVRPPGLAREHDQVVEVAVAELATDGERRRSPVTRGGPGTGRDAVPATPTAVVTIPAAARTTRTSGSSRLIFGEAHLARRRAARPRADVARL